MDTVPGATAHPGDKPIIEEPERAMLFPPSDDEVVENVPEAESAVASLMRLASRRGFIARLMDVSMPACRLAIVSRFMGSIHRDFATG